MKPAPRVRAFIEYVSDNNGALDLATGDSYPAAINDIKSGDIFVTEWRLNNQSIRHTHVIKDVSPFGYFHLIYGTTPAQSRVMSEIFGMPLSSIEGSLGGLKDLDNLKTMAKHLCPKPRTVRDP